MVLVSVFTISTLALMILIWAIKSKQFQHPTSNSSVIFDSEDMSAKKGEDTFDSAVNETLQRFKADQVGAKPILFLLGSSVFWLVLGSLEGFISSIKMHIPDFLSQWEFLTFGYLRPLHLNTVIYGWVSMAGMGISLWLIPRCLKTELRDTSFILFGTVIWNIGMILGSISILMGFSEGIEWLEYPWAVDILFVIGGALIGVPLIQIVKHRQVDHLYVSVWYILAAFLWFPALFFIANIPGVHFGVEHAIVNWWYAHNVLGLWITPFGLGLAYYLIPKIVGKPIHSYQLSLIGFWSLALFYSQVGMHHLIGGPIPNWLITLSIVTSVSMVIPVFAVGINHHMTLKGHFNLLKSSPTLRFVVFGAVSYTLVSVQGSLEALRSINTVTHFTHYTVAHAHFGVYGFASMVLFGGFYFMLPRLINWEWPSSRLIVLHFWLAAGGIIVYVLFLSIGGVLQGLIMLDESLQFKESVLVTLPYLLARTIGGGIMFLAHLVFAYHFFLLISRKGEKRLGPTLFSQQVEEGL